MVDNTLPYSGQRYNRCAASNMVNACHIVPAVQACVLPPNGTGTDLGESRQKPTYNSNTVAVCACIALQLFGSHRAARRPDNIINIESRDFRPDFLLRA